MNQAVLRRAALVGAAGAAFVLSACEREHRKFHEDPPASAEPLVAVSDLQPGPSYVVDSTAGPYGDNAYAMSDGKTLFSQMNCSGCHSHGGGGMGPPLMDRDWIYGSDPAQVYASIVEGRPNGMPSFRGKLTTSQVWELVAYVRSMSGLGRRDVRGGRNDEMYVRSSEQNTNNRPPANGGKPATVEMP